MQKKTVIVKQTKYSTLIKVKHTHWDWIVVRNSDLREKGVITVLKDAIRKEDKAGRKYNLQSYKNVLAAFNA